MALRMNPLPPLPSAGTSPPLHSATLPSRTTSRACKPVQGIQSRFTSWAAKLGAGIIQDIKARAPWYLSDWKDAWNYRVVPAAALIFFAKYAPLAFPHASGIHPATFLQRTSWNCFLS